MEILKGTRTWQVGFGLSLRSYTEPFILTSDNVWPILQLYMVLLSPGCHTPPFPVTVGCSVAVLGCCCICAHLDHCRSGYFFVVPDKVVWTTKCIELLFCIPELLLCKFGGWVQSLYFDEFLDVYPVNLYNAFFVFDCTPKSCIIVHLTTYDLACFESQFSTSEHYWFYPMNFKLFTRDIEFFINFLFFDRIMMQFWHCTFIECGMFLWVPLFIFLFW